MVLNSVSIILMEAQLFSVTLTRGFNVDCLVSVGILSDVCKVNKTINTFVQVKNRVKISLFKVIYTKIGIQILRFYFRIFQSFFFFF